LKEIKARLETLLVDRRAGSLSLEEEDSLIWIIEEKTGFACNGRSKMAPKKSSYLAKRRRQ
jgi:hypothetical protein